ncbi:MAG: hypothetical protein OXC31_13905 [Spirochaetaceae bacterium]|nr:hypothetical protein [Spirochaetaceae bacterium]
MRQEYDFSKDERGKFYQEDARLILPVYLEEDVQRYLDERAESKGMEVFQLVKRNAAPGHSVDRNGEVETPDVGEGTTGHYYDSDLERRRRPRREYEVRIRRDH